MLERLRHGEVLELRLARPPANALSPELVSALEAAVRAAPEQGARALVLSGRPGMFSGGLDVPRLLALDRGEMNGFVHSFFELLATLAACPLPMAAAIGGHAPAGGCVLALYCDHRVMAEGPYRIGLNEVQVGLMVPAPILAAFARVVGARTASRLAMSGRLVDAAEALALGLVDDLAPADAVVPRAVAWCDELLRLPPQALAATRSFCRRDLSAAATELRDFAYDRFLDDWFGEETQRVLAALVARLAKKG